MGKILIIASVVVTLITAGLGFANKGKIADAKTRADAAEADAKTKQASLTKATGELASTKKDLETAKADKAAVDAQLTTATTDLEKAKKDATDAQAQVTTLTTDKTTLTASVDDLQKKLDEALKNPQGPVAPPTNDQSVQIEELKTLTAKLQQENTDLKGKNTELQAGVTKHNNELAKKGAEGRILAVNPAWNFVVLSLGDKQGVANNTELLVKRGNQLVGKIRVTSVEPSTSIADIVANSVPRGTVISPGDHVIYGGGAQEEVALS